ncbi:MAG: alpha/beta hydrolase [Lachnospiraceae bacterium]|nr:alpha/beta hydrolase [Lachnospiraceae bacterium]
MTFHEFGKENDKVLVMIHGACMSWKNFKENIRYLKDEFHVIAVAVPGHDLYRFDEFTTMENVAKRLEDWLLENELSDIDVLYGFSMGGGIAIRLLAYNKIHVKNVILDGGITPKNYGVTYSKIKLWADTTFKKFEKKSRGLMSLVFPPDEYDEKQVDLMHGIIRCMSIESIRRLYSSMDNFHMPEQFPEMDTYFEYWYGSGEKMFRESDISYIRSYIPDVHFRQIPNMDHGQYVMGFPKLFVKQIRRLV